MFWWTIAIAVFIVFYVLLRALGLVGRILFRLLAVAVKVLWVVFLLTIVLVGTIFAVPVLGLLVLWMVVRRGRVNKERWSEEARLAYWIRSVLGNMEERVRNLERILSESQRRRPGGYDRNGGEWK